MTSMPKGNFVRHTPCDACGSHDANAEYDDGHSFCFSCGTHTQAEKPGSGAPTAATIQAEGQTKQKEGLLQGEAQALSARGISQETCQLYGYLTGHHNGEPVQIATYRDANGKPIAQKLRSKDKRFRIVGDAKDMTLFGSHLWRQGKKLVIAEGELDCLSISQIQGNRWPTVSLSHGAPSAVKTIKANWDYLQGFSEIILMFDMDQPGQKAAQEVAEILPVGKAKIAHLPCKDANECLMQGKGGAIIEAIFQAKPYRPDGIVTAKDFRQTICVDDAASAISYPFGMLNSILMGVRRQEMVTILAGSGVGKTTFVREIAHHLHMHGQKLGMLMLEESVKRTLLGLTGIHMSKNITIDRTLANDDEILAAFDDMTGEGKPEIQLYEGFGSNDIDHICNRIRFMVSAMGCDVIVLDHISILVSASEGDERRMIDAACTKFRQLVQELNFTLFMISHLRRPDGDRGHEAGAAVRLSQARGSHAIAQLSDACIAIQVDPEDPDNDVRYLRILKNRFTGQTGDAGTLVYDRETGRLLEEELSALIDPIDQDGDVDVDKEIDSNATIEKEDPETSQPAIH